LSGNKFVRGEAVANVLPLISEYRDETDSKAPHHFR
jgi:hypothetical protein